jgi:hypothetical protein
MVGRARVVRELRAAGPLLARLAAPIPARAPWLTVALNVAAVRRPGPRPVALVVEEHPLAVPDALALLSPRRHGPATVVTLVGDDGPLPPGRPPARLPARSPDVAAHLADGIAEYLRGLRGPWTLRLTGLPLGDPTLAALAALLPTAALRTSRSRVLVDGLEGPWGEVRRSRDPAVVEGRLPELLAAEPDRQVRLFLRAAARLHAAIGQLEVAVLPGGGGLLTLIDGEQRWPWWAPPGTPGVGNAMGSPLVGLTAQGGARLRRGVLSPRTGER